MYLKLYYFWNNIKIKYSPEINEEQIQKIFWQSGIAPFYVCWFWRKPVETESYVQQMTLILIPTHRKKIISQRGASKKGVGTIAFSPLLLE